MRTIEGRAVRMTDRWDAQTEQFESELRERGVELALEQQHLYLKETTREYRIFQARDTEGRATTQAVVYVSRSRLGKLFGHGVVPAMACSANDADEQASLRALRQLCRESGDLMTLRLQPTRLEHRGLLDFEARARREGFRLVDPLQVTRTLVFDLKPTVEEITERLSRKTRVRLRHKGRDLVEMAPITDPSLLGRCHEAVNASLSRTRGGSSLYDLDGLFKISRETPDRVCLLGLSLKSRPGELMAFVTGIRHGKLAEYSVAGSFHDPELRSIPFNTFLLWDLMLWAKSSGAEHLDLGGITEGGPNDPLSGISEFKRSFGAAEVERGREMLSVLHPARYEGFRAISAVVSRARSLV